MLEEFIISIISHNLYKYDLYNTYFEFYFFLFIYQTKNIIIYFTMHFYLHLPAYIQVSPDLPAVVVEVLDALEKL